MRIRKCLWIVAASAVTASACAPGSPAVSGPAGPGQYAAAANPPPAVLSSAESRDGDGVVEASAPKEPRGPDEPKRDKKPTTTTTVLPTTTSMMPTTTSTPAPTSSSTSTTARPASTTTTAPPPLALKPVASGACDRHGLSRDPYAGIVNCAVVKVDWAELQPAAGGPLVTDTIDAALAGVRQRNAASGGRHHLKLRVYAGVAAPEWAKRLDGSPVALVDPRTGAPIGTAPRFWTPSFGAAYESLMGALAARYDTVPELVDVVVSRCTTEYAEPFLRQGGSAANRDAYFAAGYTVEADRRCLAEQVETHGRVWKRTRSSVAFNPYQEMSPSGLRTDEAFTEEMMAHCRQVLGPRCVLGNNSISWPLDGGPYESLYARIRSLGAPFYFQTAAGARIGDWRATLDWAAKQGAAMVELNVDYDPDYPPAELSGYDARLEANAG